MRLPTNVTPASLKTVAAPATEALPSRDEASGGKTRQKSIWPLVAVLAIFCLAMLSLLFAGSLELDRFARDQARSLAETAISKAVADVAFITRDYGFWDAAVANLTESFDADWANDNVGEYASDALSMSRTLVLGPTNDTVYTMKDGTVSSDPSFFSPPPALLRLAALARATSWDDPQAASSFVSIDGEAFIASASVITPEKPKPQIVGSFTRCVLIFLRALDEESVADLGASYLLPDLRLQTGKAGDGYDSLPLLDDRDQAVVHLAWRTPVPGQSFLKQTAPWMAAIFLVLAGLIVMALKRAYAQAAVVEQLNDELLLRSRDLEHSQDNLVKALEIAVEANKAKADFLAVMSHELRTPLNAVIGFSDLIRNQAFGPVGHRKYAEYGNDIFTSGQHLLSLISDILDITRANAGTLTLDLRPVDLANLADKSLTLMTPQAVRQRISVDVVDRCGPSIVLGDEVRLTQILTNLINNAIKSSPEGGSIRIKISPVKHGEISLRVIDKGCGIPKKELVSVTEPFRQAGTYQTRFNPYSSENSGTGLGLAIVKRLTEAHGGRLRIASKVGLGTVVEVILPRHESAATGCNAGNKTATG
ncbi:MAG: hypothetical protein AMXMBFR74_13250 [Parvibaculum sp.]|uniref:sensor histidine kinase n=1 Tax=Parvibaculum sp. TaxID=2024848 RepID=UPI0035B99594